MSSSVRGLLLPTLLAVLLAALGATGPESLAAQERILAYDSEVEIAADGSLEVTERIRVRAEGDRIRRGIYRDFPTRYRDRYGNQVRVGFEVLGVERDGIPEPWFTERVGNGVRVNTGNDDFLPVPAEYTYTLRYRTTRQLGFFQAHDELYWNAIGTGWVFPIESGTVEVRLPEAVPVAEMTVEGYTGRQGAQGRAYEATLPAPGTARYRLTAGLAPFEGLTIVLTFPKGIVRAPSAAQRVRWLLLDNRGVLLALGGLAFFLYFTITRWVALGRDPEPGIVIARYEPTPGVPPSGMRYLRRMGYDPRCFSADLLALAVGGFLRIEREKSLFRDSWQLVREDAGGAVPETAEQRVLLSGLFPGGASSVELKASNAAALSKVREAHQKALDAHFQPSHFRGHGKQVVIAVLIAIGTVAGSLILSDGYGMPFIMVCAAVLIVGTVLFARLVRAPTSEGRALLDEVDGLALYLGVAERHELARLEGPGEGSLPPVDADRYEALLPYAVALEVEDAWTGRFTAAVGAAAAAAAAEGMRWYRGGGRVTDLSSFSRTLGATLSSQVASSSSPPGSGSGSGGGGSSGGGGGGGGGGGR